MGELKRRFIFFLIILATFLSFRDAFAQEAARQVSARMQKLESDIQAVRKSQTAILLAQDEIIQTIKNLKILVNRKGGGGGGGGT